MRNEDLVGRDEVGQGDGLVALPLLEGLDVVDEDEEVLGAALVVDLGRGGCALDHLDVCVCVCVKVVVEE